jgi:hypothetical protein
MKEDKQNNHEFNLLTDEIVDEDYFEDKTHENVAETLYKIVDSNDKGFTIGLEGSWGSGKSTVISILKKKLAKKHFQYFYFDAWAHEGDHLRRIFLESLISQLDTESPKLKELEDEISKRKRKTYTKTKQYGTTLGKWLALSILFVPLGTGIISGIDGLQLSLRWGGSPHFLFWLGVFLSAMPFFVIIGNAINISISKKSNWKDILKEENWAFLESVSDDTITQEISEDEERSSIEFERYFERILSEVFEDDSSNKLVIIVDNLDRIDANDSLKIWATLQTFLQNRNPSNSKTEWYQNIWIIVPYDMHGLSKLWEKGAMSCGDNASENNLSSCAKSFFDKCFQIRIEVPEPVLTGWESFTKKMINEAFVNWTDDEKNTVLNVLKLTRKNIGDIPTPREIKNYINQVGILRLHSHKDISTESISYYAIYRYLKGYPNSKIKSELKENKFPEEKDIPFLPTECKKHLSGIVFGVDDKKGQQLLLEPNIQDNLKDANGDELKNLAKIHENGFWNVFDHHISKMEGTSTLFNYSKAIYDGLWEDYNKQCDKFIQNITMIFKTKPPDLPNGGEIKDYLPIIYMSSDAVLLKKIWGFVLNNLETKIENDDEFDYETNVKCLDKIVTSLDGIDKTGKIFKISSDKWLKWAQEVDKQQIQAYEWILPPENIDDEIVKNIGASSPIVPGTKELLTYSINSGINNWDKLPLACKEHIFNNNGRPSDNAPSFEVLEILINITFCDDSCRDEIIAILRSHQFHNFVFYQRENNSALYSALLMAYYFKNELHDMNVAQNGRSVQGLNLAKDFWLRRDVTNAKMIYNYLYEIGHIDILWDLAECKDNKLVVDIIGLALEDEVTELFNCFEMLKKLHFGINLIDADDSDIIDKLVNQIIVHSDIEEEIKQLSKDEIVKYSNEIHLILEKTDDERLVDFLRSFLINLNKEDWDACFAGDSYLLNVALDINTKKSNFSLKNAYLDSIFEFAKQWAKNEIELSDWQKSEWNSLVNLMGKSFQKHYQAKITDFLSENNFVIKLEFYNYNCNLFDYDMLFKNHNSKIQQSFLKIVENDEISNEDNVLNLKILDLILQKDKFGLFEPEQYVSEVAEERIDKLYQSQEDESKRNIIERLATKFNVKLKKIYSEKE